MVPDLRTASGAAFVSDGPPFPGEELASRVAGTADRTWFFESGQRSVADIRAIVGLTGRRLEDHARVLDFGCGCGRIVMWLSGLAPATELHGVDIDRAAIEWATTHLRHAVFHVNRPLPPLDFADAYFDLVYCHSVFTHIDERYQDEWLRELRRVTRPGGLLLLSVHGEHALRYLEGDWSRRGLDTRSIREARERTGFVHVTDDDYVGGPFPDFYHTTFHGPGYIFAHWGSMFKIRAYVPRGSLDYQDFVLLERSTDVSSPAAMPRRAATVPAGRSLERAAAIVAAGPRLDLPTRFGWLSRLARRAVLRVLRHSMGYQREVNEATVAALRELAANQRALGERVDRLEPPTS